MLLDYVQPVNIPEANYREYVDVIGGSVGYRFPSGFRISLEGELMRRDASTNPGRSYDTVRFYTVISTKPLPLVATSSVWLACTIPAMTCSPRILGNHVTRRPPG